MGDVMAFQLECDCEVDNEYNVRAVCLRHKFFADKGARFHYDEESEVLLIRIDPPIKTKHGGSDE